MSENTENLTIKLLKEMRADISKRFERLEHLVESNLKETRFLRSHVFQGEDENQYWRNRMAELQDEIKALEARLDQVEDK